MPEEYDINTLPESYKIIYDYVLINPDASLEEIAQNTNNNVDFVMYALKWFKENGIIKSSAIETTVPVVTPSDISGNKSWTDITGSNKPKQDNYSPSISIWDM